MGDRCHHAVFSNALYLPDNRFQEGWLPLGCLEEERIALLRLKHSLNYPNGTSLPSWIEADAHCCSWQRIACSSSTGRVTELHLLGVRNEEPGDWYLNASLFLPFQQLNTLSLYRNRIAGWVEKKGGFELSRLSNLEILDLGFNRFDNSSSNLSTLWLGNITTYGNSFQSLGSFPNLTRLDLSYNNFRGRKLGDDEHSLQSLGEALPSLKNLSLQELNGTVSYTGFLDLKNLEYLDLSYSTLNNSIFQTIEMMTSLKTLKLKDCNLNGQIPTTQDMSNNDLSGFLPPCLANLTSLQQLDLFSNHLKIPVSLSPLYNLSKLKSFDGSSNEIYIEENDHNLNPKFQLEFLSLKGYGQGAGAFSKFLYHQANLQYMDLTNIQMKGEFPNWLIENNTYLQELYLENCSLSGPFLLPKNSHVNLSILSISMNHFQGQIPSEIGARLAGLKVLFMSDNGFNGSIPFSLGNISSLQVLDLSNNSLQGQIPRWIGNISSLKFLDLSENNFSGRLPRRFDTFSNLRYVYLSRNKLQGPITMAFYDSFEIFALDLSHNNLTGTIPEWIDKLSNLGFLLLSYNNLEGEIPIQLSRLDQLVLIDLSHNHLSGNILSWMIPTHNYPVESTYFDFLAISQQSFEFTTKNFDRTNSTNIFEVKGNRELGSFLQQTGWRNPTSTY
ncbi:PREDICTED: probably inactive leucine-rich repeat receptor-like protein kinase At2g25790 [Populus euphratica]|uniref:Probably inactive leucine-rich repeat receptor-like protein kinase At2g25790 n=1 Tax=Populus euphratica TaxID=75702 RepID=A0AAJ6TWC0_POPEU|nr:PREDICTED: probably inactive leucine-rich repeat receptor-like protein kinase At2g25790 [Populus euphratica]